MNIHSMTNEGHNNPLTGYNTNHRHLVEISDDELFIREDQNNIELSM